MKDKFLYVARCILLISVLSGICFSSGEGVQLLPFPVREEGSEKSARLLPFKNFKSYNISARSSGAHSLAHKIKSQKNIKKDLACGQLPAGAFKQPESLPARSERIRQKSGAPLGSGFLISPSDRAPPAA